MQKFQEKNKRKRWRIFLSTTPMIVILIIIIIVFAWNIFIFATKAQDTARNRELVENKVKDLEKNKNKLVEDINTLNTTEGVEAKIREKYGLAKEGEGEIVVVDEPKEDIPLPSNKGALDAIKDWFR